MGLEGLPEVVAHPLGGVGVEAAHPRHLVAEALLGEDLRDAIFGHPGLVAVPEPMRGQTGFDREPARQWGVLQDDGDPAAPWWREFLAGGSVCAHA